MTIGYQPYPVKELKSGINTYLQPWIRPAEAFEPLTNAYVSRGTVSKRSGYSQFGATVPDTNPIMGIMNYVNQTSGAISLVVATTVNLYLYNAGSNTYGAVTTPPTFTGNITQFFNWTNWQPSSGATSYLWMCNNKDAVTRFDGAASTQPAITVLAGVTVSTCLDIKVYKQRLLLIRPTLTTGGVQNQSIYWSAQNDPTNWRVDVAGAGGFLAAPTGDIIISAEFIRDVLVVFFSNSTWIFRDTGNAVRPFEWIKINDSKSSNAPYGSISYDQICTSVGSTGLIAADGVNVDRYDVPIIDYYETNFSEQYFAQTFAQRYDNLNQGWMLYVSNETPFSLVGAVAPGSDSALIYNFLEKTWATYKFTIPLTCLGTFYRQVGATWALLAQSWQNTDKTWNSFSSQKGAPILLAGGIDGKVYYMDDESQVTDNGTSIPIDIVSTRWNPIVDAGQKVQFGYIDVYYYVSSVNTSDPISVSINFYVNNSNNLAGSRTLTLDGPVGSEYAFKRIYLNLVGEFIQMEIVSSEDSFIQFVGFVIWARPAGRLTP